MAQIVSEKFREILYSGEADHTVSLTIGGKPIDIENIKSIKISDPIIDKTNEAFYIGTFISKQVEIEFYKPEDIDLTKKLHLEIGTMVDGEYEMIPIGDFNIENSSEDYYAKAKIVALDDGTLFKPNVDISRFFTRLNIRYNSILNDSIEVLRQNITENAEIINDSIVSERIRLVSNEFAKINHYIGINYEINENKIYITANVDEDGNITYENSLQTIITNIQTEIQKKIEDYDETTDVGDVTAQELLEKLCEYFLGEDKLGTYPTINNYVITSYYDNSLSAKRYISYIAEIMGGNAKIGRDGKLYIEPIKSVSVAEIDATASKTWSLMEKYQISRVLFMDALRSFEFGDTSENTLYIRQDNIFVAYSEDESAWVVENIYNAVVGATFYNLKCENYGDYSLDSWDLITYNLDGVLYPTFHNVELKYEMNISSTVEVVLPSKQVSETTNIVGGSDENKFNILKTIIDQTNAKINLIAGQVDENKGTYEELQIGIDGVTNTFKTLGGSNLIRNSALIFEETKITNKEDGEQQYSGYEYWEGYSAIENGFKPNLKKGQTELSETKTSILAQEGLFKQSISVPPPLIITSDVSKRDNKYTLSFKYRPLIRNSELILKFNTEETILEKEILEDSNECYEYEVTQELEETEITIEFECSVNNGYEIFDLMLNKGDTRAPYSQHLNETTTDTVKIGKGIQVESSATNTITRIDSDGQRTYSTRLNKVVNRNTDTGTYTNSLECENEAKINKLFIQEVDEQVWLNGL